MGKYLIIYMILLLNQHRIASTLGAIKSTNNLNDTQNNVLDQQISYLDFVNNIEVTSNSTSNITLEIHYENVTEELNIRPIIGEC